MTVYDKKIAIFKTNSLIINELMIKWLMVGDELFPRVRSHFGRIFGTRVGETTSEIIRRSRLYIDGLKTCLVSMT